MKIIDLSLSLKSGMRGVSVVPAFTKAKDGWNATNWTIYSHAGTHVDAKIHFDVSPETIDAVALDAFCGHAWVAHIENVQPNEVLTVERLGDVAAKVAPGDCLLLHTGWSAHVENPPVYRDQLPRIGDELARWIVDRKLRLIGVEGPSVASVNDMDEITRIHEILLGGGITICEGLANLDQLGEQTYFMALPLKLHQGDGSPTRAVAIEGLVPSA